MNLGNEVQKDLKQDSRKMKHNEEMQHSEEPLHLVRPAVLESLAPGTMKGYLQFVAIWIVFLGIV